MKFEADYTSFRLLPSLIKLLGVPKLELLPCLCEPDRAKQSPTLQEIVSAEDHRLATASSSIISDLGISTISLHSDNLL